VSEGVFIFRQSPELEEALKRAHTSNAKNRGEPEVAPEARSSDVEMTVEKEAEFSVDDPFFGQDPEFESKYIAAYDPAVRDAPDTTTEVAVKEVDEILEEADARIKQEALEVEEGKVDPALEKRKEVLQEGKKKIAKAEEASKASIVCGPRNQ